MRIKDDYERPALTIVVPVYNIEKYVAECIKSILAQDYGDYELIIVDDGSTDSSGRICDTFANDRTRVVHTENRGLSEARNAGMDVSRGEYILFMDGDDVMQRGRLKKVMLAVIDGGTPVTVFPMDGFESDTGEEVDLGYNYNPRRIRYGSKAQVMDELMSHEAIPWSTSCNIFSLDFLRQHRLRFRADAYGVEDCRFYLDLAMVCNSYSYTQQSLIKYRMHREGSIMSTPDLLKLHARAETYEDWISYAGELMNYGAGEGIMHRMGDAFFYNVIHMYHKGIQDEFFDIIDAHMTILSYATGIKKRIIYHLVRVFGAKAALWLTVRGKYSKG